MELLADRIADFLIHSGGASEDIRDIIVYGVKSAFSFLVNLIFTFVVGLILGVPFELFVFFVPFSVLRMLSGGFHAKTFFGCVAMSLLIMIFVSVMINISFGNAVLLLSITFNVIAVSITFLFAPVVHTNHPISIEDITKFRTRSRIIVLCCSLTCLGLLALDSMEYMFCISLGIFMSAVSTFAAFLIKKGGSRNEKSHNN